MIPPGDYDGWIPEAKDNEDEPGNTINVRVELQKEGQPGAKPRRKAQFKFELEACQEPGVCLNWPPKDKAPGRPLARAGGV